jgi:dTDP-4-amino-4,6-dideoxygalactose transaminase
MIVFNKTYLTGKELEYLGEALQRQTSGNGSFTKKCHDFFRSKYGFKKVLLTTSCTDALEMAALLLEIKPGDEVIMPSFTFVSTANAFVLRGATIVFADSLPDHPNIDPTKLEQLITPKTKAIVVVHYAGVAVDMDQVISVAAKFNLFVVEDAAQAVDSYYKGRPLGSIGHLGCFSFHDTKNIVSGEGGMLVINDDRFIDRAEIIWEKGTNRSAFIRGEVDKYGWVDVGSSFLPSELTAAFLYAQLEHLDSIQNRRLEAWNYYMQRLLPMVLSKKIVVPQIPGFSKHNAHIFYVVANDLAQRNHVISSLKAGSIQAHFHYPSLHLSKFYNAQRNVASLTNSVNFSERLIRLPLYVELRRDEQDYVIEKLAAAIG